MSWSTLARRGGAPVRPQAGAQVSPPVRPAPSPLPARVAFVDVETTGMGADDRIVSAAVILLDTAGVTAGEVDCRHLHVICDPGRSSHPRAEEVHGYDDWVLRHQEGFAANAAALHDIIHRAALLVAHNASFDLRFLAREFALAGLPAIAVPSLCTMRGWRAARGSPASLSVVAGQLGLARRGRHHGALEDCWLAMMVYLHLNGHPLHAPFGADPMPANYREPPPRPAGTPARR